MALFPFLQKPKEVEEPQDDSEKKIEFAQKLSESDIEGAAAPKGGNFDFLKHTEEIEREPGEKAAVEIMPEPELPEKKLEEETGKEEKPDKEKKVKQANAFLDFFKFSSGPKVDKNSSRILEVNLVKGEIVKFFDWQRGILLILVAIFATMAGISFIYWGISWWGANSKGGANSDYLGQYYKISKEINDLSPQVDQVVAFKNRLDQVNFLLARHIYWTNFFSFLEDNTLSDVYFSNFSGSISGSYSLAATSDSLDTIDAQIKKLLANPFIKSAEVDSGSVSGQGGKPVVNFSLSFTLDPKVFLK